MQLIDSHCHLDFEDLHNRLPAVLENAQNNGVSHMLCIAVNMEDYPRVLALAENHDNLFASVGKHPCYEEGHEPTLDELIQLGSHERVIAIGETGLDYFHNNGDLTWQHDRFRTHIQAANALDKPIIVHTRDAGADCIRLLREENAQQAKGVIHCFTEDWDFAQQVLDLDFYLSFSGIVTFKSAKQIQEVTKRAPLDRILIETDAPYLAPVPYRGKTNEPAYVRHTAEYIAELRGMSLEAVAEATTNNFFQLFKAASR